MTGEIHVDESPKSLYPLAPMLRENIRVFNWLEFVNQLKEAAHRKIYGV